MTSYTERTRAQSLVALAHPAEPASFVLSWLVHATQYCSSLRDSLFGGIRMALVQIHKAEEATVEGPWREQDKGGRNVSNS